MRIRFFALAALALLLGACTQDEAGFLPEGAEGTSIVFTATGLNPAATATAGTRAPVDGNWEGVQSVAVMMDGTVKAYDVTPYTADPTSATLTSTDPYYWTNHNDITVTAWWPYTAGETTPPAVKVKANQSAQKDFEGSDLIVADGQTVTYGSPTLRFTHRTARVTIVLTDYTEGLASVQLTGLSTEGDNPDIIVPYDKSSNTYIALVAPQSVAAGTTFITCTFTNGKTFVYKMKNAADWQAGGEYTYTVSQEYGHTVDKSPIAKAMFYMYTRFEQLSGYVNDAQFCIDNNPVERSIRPLTLNRKNTLFSGSHEAAHAAAIFFSLMGCCRENKVNPKLWMQDVLIRVQEKEREEKNDYTDLLPFNWKG